MKLTSTITLPPDTACRTLAVIAQKGSGKRLALTTPLPTPTGWTTMGDVRKGDLLYADDGKPCRVTAVHPVQLGDSYTVRFSDGSVITADAEHLWLTHDYAARRAASL